MSGCGRSQPVWERALHGSQSPPGWRTNPHLWVWESEVQWHASPSSEMYKKWTQLRPQSWCHYMARLHNGVVSFCALRTLHKWHHDCGSDLTLQWSCQFETNNGGGGGRESLAVSKTPFNHSWAPKISQSSRHTSQSWPCTCWVWWDWCWARTPGLHGRVANHCLLFYHLLMKGQIQTHEYRVCSTRCVAIET